MTFLEAKTEYWTSPGGIRKRVDQLGEDFTFHLVNNALQAYGRKNDVYGWEWVGSTDEKTCDYCDGQIGRFYRLGQFLPRLPAHPHCRCEWRLIQKRGG